MTVAIILSELITRGGRSQAYLREIADRRQLMPDGIMEMIDEWSSDAELVGDFDGYQFDLDVVQQIIDQLSDHACSPD